MTIEARLVEGEISLTPSTVCPGDPVTVTPSALFGVPPYSYKYEVSGNAPVTVTTNTWVFNPLDDAVVSCIIIDGCGELGYTNDLTVNVHPRPTVHLVNDTLYCSTADTYQWYQNGNLIPGATGSGYHPTQPGQYTVVVTDGFGCTSTSDIYYYQLLGINGVNGTGKLAIIPNPSDGNFTIRCDAINTADKVELRITDVSGKLVDMRNNIQFTGAHTYIYRPDVKLVNGSYYVEIASGGKIYRERMLVVK
jgi:hypothetical protein